MVDRTFLHYKILEEIGAGGRGIVYKARDNRLGRTVAVKCLPYYTHISSEERQRFEQEAKTAAHLNHPGIATIFGFEEVEHQMFIIMELIEGQDLRKLLNRAEKDQTILTAGNVIDYALKIAEALQTAHDNGIVHRDIKPENIMITTSNQVKILDFGLAKMRGSELITKDGTMMGTAAYMSPEQLSAGPVDFRTDIWSWGVMFYEMLTGARPFTADYEQAVIYSILNDNPREFHPRFPDLPQKIEKIIHGTLSKIPADRYANFNDLLKDLKTLKQESTDRENFIPEPESAKQKVFPAVVKGLTKSFGIQRIWHKAGLYLVLAFFVILLPAIIFFFLKGSISSPEPHIKKIAVLPFVNINNNPDDEYFSDGIMEDILTQLVKISNLKVISRTTMMTYKNTTKTLFEISKELKADVILEGSVRRDAEQVRIAAQLIDANSDEHLWAETYDREVSRIFPVQSEIALHIAEALNTALSSEERDRLAVKEVLSPEVYNLLLKGGYYLSQGSRIDVSQAIDQFKQAITLDINNARAWAQLATAYARQADLGAVSSEEGYENARHAARKALDLDDQLAQAHTIMGWIKRSYDWDWEGAEKECRRALQIAPGDVTVIRNMANMEKSLGHFEEAIVLMQKAVDLDPRKVPIYTSLGLLSMYAGRYKKAEDAYSKAIELNPEYPVAHTFLGLVYLLQGDHGKALKEIQKETDEGWQLYGLAQVYYTAGLSGVADSTLTLLIAKYGDDSAYQVAQVYAWRNNISMTFKWLEKAYMARDGGLSEFKGDPFMKKIVADPRYAAFMKKMRLPL